MHERELSFSSQVVELGDDHKKRVSFSADANTVYVQRTSLRGLIFIAGQSGSEVCAFDVVCYRVPLSSVLLDCASFPHRLF